jgi:hypothetical protein
MHRLQALVHLPGMPTHGARVPGGDGTAESLLPARHEGGIVTAIPVEIISRPPQAHNAAKHLPKQEPAGIVITTVDALTAENVRGCGDDNPYN